MIKLHRVQRTGSHAPTPRAYQLSAEKDRFKKIWRRGGILSNWWCVPSYGPMLPNFAYVSALGMEYRSTPNARIRYPRNLRTRDVFDELFDKLFESAPGLDGQSVEQAIGQQSCPFASSRPLPRNFPPRAEARDPRDGCSGRQSPRKSFRAHIMIEMSPIHRQLHFPIKSISPFLFTSVRHPL